MNTIDVVVPCHRYGRFLRECVGSVLSQSLPDLRVLIIDDASPDDSGAIADALAREDPRVTAIRHPTNRGHTATFNEGLAWAGARYLLLLSADDMLLPGALERAVTCLDANPHAGFAFGKCMEHHGAGPLRPQSTAAHDRHRGTHVLTGEAFVELSGGRNLVPTPTAVVRTSLQRQVGGYHLDLPHTGDMEMWLRLAAHADVAVIDAFQAVYRRHGENMSLSYANAGTCVPDFEHRQAALEIFFRTHGKRLANVEQLQVSAMKSLARDAVGRASSAYNDGNLRACGQLRRLARGASPDVERTSPWFRLWLKTLIGQAAWRRIHALRQSRAAARTGPPSGPSARADG